MGSSHRQSLARTLGERAIADGGIALVALPEGISIVRTEIAMRSNKSYIKHKFNLKSGVQFSAFRLWQPASWVPVARFFIELFVCCALKRKTSSL